MAKKKKKIRSEKKTLNEKHYKILPFVPAALCFAIILGYGVNVIFWDEWELVNIIQRLESRSLTFTDLWKPHNEHRIFFPQLIYLFIGSLTRFNSKAQMITSFFVICAGYCCFAKYFKTYVESPKIRYMALTVIGLFMFSPVQTENFLWGFQIGFIMAAVLPVISLFFLSRYLSDGKKGYFYVAVIIGIIASFSSAQGLIVWPAALAGLIIHFRKHFYKSPCFIICAFAGVLSWAAYFTDFNNMGQHGDHLKYIMHHPVRSVGYLMAMIGAPVIKNLFALPVAVITFIVVLLMAIQIFFKYSVKNIFPAMVILFSFMSLVTISFGRVILGSPFTGRYTTFSIYIYVGLFSYVFVNPDAFIKKRSYRLTTTVILSVILALELIMYPASIPYLRVSRNSRLEVQYALITYKTASIESLKVLFPDASFVRYNAPYLESKKYNAFAK